MKYVTLAVAMFAVAMFAGACQSHHEEGVKSSYKSQWTTVNAGTQATTDAAKAVLEGEGLKEISASATNVDGKAWAKKADGTKVTVDVKKVTDASSEVSVTVGTMGDPALGAEMAKKIKLKVEGAKK